ncbi:MAG: type II toxin-antitoxin system ParD family antitoxin [Saprospiraceae bacterium]|nr:type II toxin-antitoxin system ParD family antitoxin [Saprospiraceae bacterium]
MNISFTDKQEKYIASQLDSGDFKNASEVVRDALRLHEIYRHRVIEELRTEIAKGWDGPASLRTPSQIAQEKSKSAQS